MPSSRALVTLWRSVKALPELRRLLELRAVSSFGDGIFQGALVGALLFDPEKATNPWEIAGAFAVLFLPYSLLGPFAGALLDRWDRRKVLIGANAGRVAMMLAIAVGLEFGKNDVALLLGALVVNGFTRFVTSGLSAALPDVVPRPQVVQMNSVATAVSAATLFFGAISTLLPRWWFGAGHVGIAAVVFCAVAPIAGALWLSVRFAPGALGPADTSRSIHGSVLYAVATGWGYGIRTVLAVRSVSATLVGVAAHRVVFGINTLLVLLIVRHSGSVSVAGFGIAVVFAASTGAGSFLANVLTPVAVLRWGRFATVNVALTLAAVIQLAAIGLDVPVMMVCSFLLGFAGQVVKLCADSAMQLDVDDALRGHVFTVQDALFWIAFVTSITLCAAVIPDDGQAPGLVVAGVVTYLVGLGVHTAVGRSRTVRDDPRGLG